MINIEIIDLTAVVAFWLIFTRCLAIITQLPIFDNVTIPGIVKILSAIMISLAFYPALKGEMIKDIQYLGVDNFWMLTIFHSVIGLAIGNMVKSIMHIFTASGAIMTQQVGFAAIRYFDPSSSSQVGPFERLIQWTILIIILSSGALLPMFKGLYQSFFSIHIYDIAKMAHVTEFFMMLFKSIFLSALMLASPIIFTNVLIMSVLGIIARTVPQMNVIMVSFIVNIGLGLMVFAACSDEYFHVAYRIYTEKLGEWFQFVT